MLYKFIANIIISIQNDKMKILHIHTSFTAGGIEAMICGLANEMVKTQEVSVCSIFKPNESDVFWNKLSPNVCKCVILFTC